MAEENNNQCVGITADGRQCQKRKCAEVGDGTRCRTHFNVVQRNGPHQTEIDEIKAKYNLRLSNTENDFTRNHPVMGPNEIADFARRNNVIHEEKRIELNAARERHAAERERLGHDPDAAANERRAAERIQRQEAAHARQDEIRQRVELLRQRQQLNRIRGIVADLAGGGAADVRPLAQFTADPQNVHTTAMVRQTKEIVEKVRKIPVPEEYRWNMNYTSRTAGEIIAECKLSIHASCQMLTQYSHKTAIYDIEEGIYGKVLDSVWQFIKNSPDKEDLCRILKQEMEDNIGMCAQGNLTRLCNILAGYMEGIGPQESPAEILGRKLPLLMGVEDENDRLKLAYNLLVDLKIPESHWLFWVEPLVEGSVQLKSSGSGEIIGFEIVA